MSAGKVIATGMLGAVAYLYWTTRTQEPTQVVVQPAVAPAPQPKRNYAPLAQWGLDTLVTTLNRNTNRTGGWNKGQGLGGFLNGILGTGKSTPKPTIPTTTPRPAQRTTSGKVDVPGLKQLIGSIEAPQGYNQVYGGSRIQPPRPLETMTVDEVLDWQNRSVRAGSASTASGRYQIIRGTLKGLRDQGHVSGSDRFDARTQDRLADVLLERRGLSKYQSGQISAERFANNLAQEWASLPVVTGNRRGQSHYHGDGLNKALTTPERVLSRLGVR